MTRKPVPSRSPASLSAEEGAILLETLRGRFEKYPGRHKGLEWADVAARLATQPGKLAALSVMEATGGEPDVVGRDAETGEYVFFDCSAETPKPRVSFCYDREGWESRKEHRPKNTAMDAAAEMGVELLDEAQYAELQGLGEFDLKTSSWVRTPEEIRGQGGALYGERRYGRIFMGHNGAQSYYNSRGFRGVLRV